MQDDGLYLSPMYLRHRLEAKDPVIRIERNQFKQVLTALAFGGTWPVTRDEIYIYRNVFDLRYPIQTGRPSTQSAEPRFSHGKLIGDHGSPPWPAMRIYHNTVVALDKQRDAAMASLNGTKAGNERRVFNNIFLHLDRMPGLRGADPAQNAIADGNLYWSSVTEGLVPDKVFGRYRKSEQYAASRELYPAGASTNAVLADPLLKSVLKDRVEQLEPTLKEGSAAIDSGVEVPSDWPDSLREKDAGKPDIGALPLGTELFSVGRKEMRTSE